MRYLLVLGALVVAWAIVWASVRYGRARQLADDQATLAGVERRRGD